MADVAALAPCMTLYCVIGVAGLRVPVLNFIRMQRFYVHVQLFQRGFSRQHLFYLKGVREDLHPRLGAVTAV